MVSPSLTLLRTQSDERLIALARAGHERAFEAIVERYRKPLLRHGRRLLSSEARAEDAVQQAFMAAWAALERGDDVRHLSGWLHRIVHNAALNSLRGERDDWTELREWLEGAGAPDDEVERREMLRDTLANLAALPTRQREALLRIAVEGESAEEVGSSLGLTEGAVRQLLYRARSALRTAATAVTPWPIASWL
ncbi:MAG TPA: sigma-70 family RNA polymerase sigma factor, partial [Solirubrobacteraceae bacterium]|nr:sigma-70 family RNA polymerase sigma factor [Solirubrobacteraceae bacterium]